MKAFNDKKKEMKTKNKPIHNQPSKGETTMRTTSLFSRFSATVFTVALVLVVAGFNAQAATSGTRAGAKISSTATAVYQDKTGNGNYNATPQTVSIYVALKPAVSLSAVSANSDAYDGSYAVYSITVANNGNGADAYEMEASITSGGADMDSVGWYSNVGLTAALGGSTGRVMRDTVSAETGSNTTTVYAKVYIKPDPSYPGYDNQNVVLAFSARSTANNTDTTYKTLDGSTNIVVAPSFLNSYSAAVSRTTRLKESIFALNITSGTSTVRPGGTIDYSLSLINSGHGGAQSMTITVTYPTAPAALSFSSGTGWTDHGTYATYAVSTINAGATTTPSDLILAVPDNASELENTTLTPTDGISYQDTTGTSRTRLNSHSEPTHTILFKAYAPTIAVVDTTLSGDPGDTVTTIYTITNNSNGPDAYHVRYSTASQSPASWSYVYYYDINGNNSFDAGTDSLFAAGLLDSHATKKIAKGSSITIFLRAAVPSGLTSTPVHVVNLMSSYRDSITTGDFNLFSQVTAKLPSLTVGRSRVIQSADTGSGAIVPGDSVEFYTYVENDGTGEATSVVITDDGVVANTSNAANRIFISDGTTDYEFDSVKNNTVHGGPSNAWTVTGGSSSYTINVGTMNSGDKRIIRYILTIQ
jgi:hypothetical protein